MKIPSLFLLLVVLLFESNLISAKESPSNDLILTVAVFDFESKDEAVRDLGVKVSALINATLSADPRIITVERAELEKAMGEQELGLSGTIQSETAAKVGNLTGAKVLITGRVFKVDQETILVAKIIGTETSRVFGDKVKGPSGTSISELSDQLAKKIADIVAQKAENLVAKVEKIEDRIEKIHNSLPKGSLPTVSVHIPERHFGGPTIDPAAETEIGFILKKCGFTLIDPKSGDKADVEFEGEAFSEMGMRKGNLVSCKARVELKVLDRASGKILGVDRQTAVAVDLSEQIAGKTALQKAAQAIAERLIPLAVR